MIYYFLLLDFLRPWSNVCLFFFDDVLVLADKGLLYIKILKKRSMAPVYESPPKKLKRAMEVVQIPNNGTEPVAADPVDFARSYQIEALEQALEKNTIVFLETGAGKTLVAIMLLRSYAYLLRKPSRDIAVFLVPTVVLVPQQAEAVRMHTDLKVGMYWGEMGVDYWDGADWRNEQETYEVLVMTPMILLNALRHSFLSLENIKVLIFDECHNARGKHPYACIMTEFYHYQKGFNSAHVPRILGMTASPVKAKASSSSSDYLQQISELENLMNSKVYTIADESVLAKFIPFSTTKLKIYNHVDIPYNIFESAVGKLNALKEKHEFAIRCSNLQESAVESTRKKLSKLHSTFLFCINELGVWLALKAAETLSREDTDIFSWGKLDVCCETVIRDFSLDASKVFSAYIPSGPQWSIGIDMKADMDAGYLSSKVICLIESLLGYKHLKDLRSIIFVERVITAFVLPKLLNILFPVRTGWNTDYTAGNSSGLQSQSRQQQNKIVEEFRKGTVNIIVATSILEEGLDVQSCNLVIRFDPSSTVCSFIQSRGRARMEKSEFLLMVRSQDTPTIKRMKDYILSGEIMRAESLRHASLPCSPYESKMLDGFYYRVESTGAIVTLNSSVALIYFYCSRLPSDGYFKPNPRCKLDKALGSCTLNFPKNCPIGTVTVEGNPKMLKQLACLEACKQLHQIGALTDHLVPYEEAEPEELGSEPYFDEQGFYFPPELVSHSAGDSAKSYHCYLIELVRNFEYDIPICPIVLAVRTDLGFKDENVGFELEVDRGNISVQLKYLGEQRLTIEEVHLCRRFQTTLLRILLDHDLKKLKEVLSSEQSRNGDLAEFDYLVLPSNSSGSPSFIDWKCVLSVLFPCENFRKEYLNFCLCKNSSCRVNTKDGLLCRRMLEDSLVYTPHNGRLYVINGTLDGLDGNSLLRLTNGEEITYKEYYKLRYGIDLCFRGEPLLRGKQIFPVKNYLLRSRKQKERESSNTTVELPPELCFTIMSPISIATVYSFSFVPSIMHRIESLLIAINLRKMHLDHCKQKYVIPASKVLEAITAKKCQETFHLESLETLGDSFLKYAACQQLFKTHQTHHEGLLSIKKDKIISNNALRKLGCDRKLPGFIRNGPFDPKTWIIPGDQSKDYILNEESLSSTGKVYNKGSRTLKSKTVADVVEALIGAFLSSGGEPAALIFMDWLGIKVDFVNTPYERHFPIQAEKHMNIKSLEALLGYSFCDSTLLLEALTHGSYMLPEIPRCYQRLEFLGDAVLDYLITRHLYYKYPWLSPGLLTDLRSASVNNDCYAQSALRAGLHKHVLHASQELHRHIVEAVHNFQQFQSEMTFGWESESTLPKVLGDIIESLAGAIIVDSGYNKDILFPIMRRLLEPMITPATMTLHPVRELTELCQKERYVLKKSIVSSEKRVASITVEVEANGVTYKHTCTAADKKTAKKLASKAVLISLKEATSSKDSSVLSKI